MTLLLALAVLPGTAAPQADTLLLVAPQDGLATAQAVATVILAVVALGVLVAVGLLLLQLRRLTSSLKEVTRRMEVRAGPVVDRARSVAENVEFITTAVRTDVQKLNEAVARITQRLNQASDRMEERIEEFNALVKVLQEEAEEILLDTAATVRGVRAGSRALTDPGRQRPPSHDPAPADGDEPGA